MSDKNFLLYNSFNGARVWTSPAIMQRLRRGSNPIEGLKRRLIIIFYRPEKIFSLVCNYLIAIRILLIISSFRFIFL